MIFRNHLIYFGSTGGGQYLYAVDDSETISCSELIPNDCSFKDLETLLNKVCDSLEYTLEVADREANRISF